MKIYVNIKQAGSRKKVLSLEPYELDFTEGTLADLIAAFAKKEVLRYNERQDGRWSASAMMGEDERLTDLGIRPRYADSEAAVRTALDGFEDGLVRILQNETELTDMNSTIRVSEGDVFTFIRLTFLAGRMW